MSSPNMRTTKSQHEHTPQVGAPDPERRNSPIQYDPEQPLEFVHEAADQVAGCYFNDQFHAEGSLILSGSTYLRCEHGVWAEVGTSAPVPP